MNKNPFNFPIKECPNCGGKEIVIRQYINGYGEYYVDLETGEIDATELYGYLQHRNTGKYAVCCECGKKLFKVNNDLEVQE